ncbi:Sec-independent protein translocase protein TatB [Pseudoalteromonas sp. T1lg23B]|uniref:Sec-independent protein translocase protein TatB n=1 Tax=Pseudoalteromonas sp. T1lg23B TaxID=2077097 RepID=UPI000CF6B0FF|nr:Sec-independent protein translocase protein TatB [Pseudoalteromonas sp. T1lg23B]
MGIWELMVVFVVGLIVLGPERLPIAIRTVLRWINKAKSMMSSIQTELNEDLHSLELKENLRKAAELRSNFKVPDIQHSLQDLTKVDLRQPQHRENPNGSQSK